MQTHGEPKPIASGKRGNVGGVSTPGRHGSHAAAMRAGVKNLVTAGPGTKKAVKHLVLRPEGAISIDAGNVKAASGAAGPAAGAPKTITSSGHQGIHMGVRAQASVSKDTAGAIKHKE